MNEAVRNSLVIADGNDGRRLDQVLAECWPDYSRSRIAGWIREGRILLDGQATKPRQAVRGGQQVLLEATLEPHPGNPRPQAIDLEVLVEQDELLIVNKPPGLVVHPGAGHAEGTLVNALLHFDRHLECLPRAGLIHRLDKDTSGCLLVARTFNAHRFLVAAMKRRRIKRSYQALVWGRVIAGGRIEQALGRHPVDRRRQIVRADGRPAVTHYRVARHLAGSTLLEVELETGRTHQIRVHMAYARHPIVGDPSYGRRGAPAGLDERQRQVWLEFRRQALHAWKIVVPHPRQDRLVSACAPLPEDFESLLEALSG